MGSDYYLNPPQPVTEIVASRVTAAVAVAYVVGAMTHGWKVTLTPDNILQPEDGLWTVSVFKGKFA